MSLLRHFLTASRSASSAVQERYTNVILYGSITLAIALAVWAVLGNFFFTDFSPWSYWNLVSPTGMALTILGPATLYAFLQGQLDWFSDDKAEDESIVSTSLPFKLAGSLYAGVVEELLHRGVFIWYCLIASYLLDRFMGLGVWIAAAIVCMVLRSSGLEIPSKAISIGICIIGAALVTNSLPAHPLYAINGWCLGFYQSMCANPIALGIGAALLMGGGAYFSYWNVSWKGVETMHVCGATLFAILFGVWTAYALPLGFAAIGAMPILAGGAKHPEYLLYVSAAFLSNTVFKNVHPGFMGMLSAYVTGMYLFYVAFVYGLLWAIVVHLLYDAVLFTSEHVVQVVKNRHLANRFSY